jgi:adenosylcobinamide-phosphate synthase
MLDWVLHSPATLAGERLAILLGAVALEAAFAELPGKVHPVVWMGRATKLLLRIEPSSPRARFVFGALLTLGLASFVWATFFWIAQLTIWPWRLLVESVLLHSTFSVRGLMHAGKRMRGSLANSLEAGREALLHLCSRDPSRLREPELVGATIESLIENTCDSYVAPLVYFSLGGVPAAAAYRLVNTLDSMIGYRGRYEYTGKFAARLDDVLNFVPARISAALLLFVGALSGRPVARALETYRREHRKTASPNAGVTMSLAAGLLGVTLTKPLHYELVGGPRAPERREIATAEAWVFWVFVTAVTCLTAVLGFTAVCA